MKISQTVSDLSIGKKLTIAIAAVAVLFIGIASAYIVSSMTDIIKGKNLSSLDLETKLVSDMIAVEDMSFRKGADEIEQGLPFLLPRQVQPGQREKH